MDANVVKQAATRRWPEIISRLGSIDERILDGKHHPCPRCGGKDRFRLVDCDAGAVLCNQCFSKGNGDGLAALQWLCQWDFVTTVRRVADYLGIANGNGKPCEATDLVEQVAKEKRVSAESLRAFGAAVAMRGKLPVVRFPVYNHLGEPHSFFDLAPGAGKGWFKAGKGSSGMFFPHDAAGNVRLPQPGETWHAVEGAKDAAALTKLDYLAAGMPGSALPTKFSRLFRGVEVVVIPDRDHAGEDGAEKTCSRLHRVAAFVRLVTLPAEFRESDGADVRDILALPDGETLLRQVIADAQPWTPSEPTIIASDITLPTINASERELKIITPQAWQALLAANQPERLFRHGGIPSRIESDDDGGPIVRPLTKERMRYELARAANWEVTIEKGDSLITKLVQPPALVVEDLLATPDPPLPVLQRIVEAPVFSPAGILQTSPGYHPASYTYLMGNLDIGTIPPKPTKAEIQRARDLFRIELMGEFPFVCEADSAHALALALLLYVRDMIGGPTPLHLIEAPEAGTGKGLLVDVLLRPAIGRHVSIMAEARDDDEWRKRITSKLREGRPVLVIDNLARPLDSGVLSAALTATSWEDRILGKSETVRVPVRCAWVATGNNPVMTTELARRCIRIRLDAKRDRPWTRAGFKIDNLRQWADDRRAGLVRAALVLIQAWIAAGRPPHKQRLGSFEAWSEVIGGILDVAEVSGFLGNLDQFYEQADREGAVWREFFQRWWERFTDQPVGTKELFPIAAEMDGFDLGRGQEKSQRTVFGKKLGKQRDRVIGEYRVVFMHSAHGVSHWKLQPKVDMVDVGGRFDHLPYAREDDQTHTVGERETSTHVNHVNLDDDYERQERAAILQFDGGLERVEAERRAGLAAT